MNDKARSLARLLAMGTAALVVVVLAAGLVMHLYGGARLRRVQAALGGNLEASEPAREVVDLAAETNAASWLVAGAQAIVWSRDSGTLIGDLSLLPFSEWSPEQRRDAASFLANQSGAVETLHRAAALESWDWGLGRRPALDTQLPPLVDLIRAARVLLVEARLAFGENRVEDGLLALVSLRRLAESLESEPVLIASLIGIASERMLLVATAEALGSREPWAADAAMITALGRTPPDSDVLACARQVVYQEGRTTSEAVLAGRSVLGTPPDGRPASRRSFAWRYSMAGLAAAQILEAWSDIATLVELPFGTHREAFFGDTAVPTALPWPSVSMAATPSLANAVARFQLTSAQRALLGAAVAVRRVGLEEGHYPDAVGSLPFPLEPDPFTGKPLVYTVNDDGSAVLALDGGSALAAEILPGLSAARSVVPVTLPAPPGA